MSEHPHAQIARAAWQAVSRGDVEALEEIFAPDVVWHATARTTWKGDHRGRRAVLDFLARIGESMDVFDARLDDVLVSESRASMLFHISGRVGERRLEVDYQLLACIEAGRVVEVWTMVLDPAPLEAFFGS